ncbi:DMT family transporter [Propionivibrio limicola]|uniref:DMT family transporter n=1 Tax=Propionivibrio limicola TaxID=167645 RepID=UPI001291155C|nr:DMT family transporter [Propionivibrio limicola]
MPWKNWSPDRLGVTLAILAAFGFSFKAILIKLAYAVPLAVRVDPVTLLSLRMVLSLPAFIWLAITSSRGAPPLTRRDWIMLLALGLLGYYGASLFDFLGLQYISAGLERLILFTYPTLTILIAVLFMGKTLHRREIFSLLLSYVGIGLAFAHDLEFSEDTHNVIIGALFVFGSSLTYALYLSGSGPMIARLGATRFTALVMIVSSVAAQLHFFASQPLAAYDLPPRIYAYILAIVAFSTVLPMFMQSASIRLIGTSRSVLIGTLGPVLTIFFGWWILDEPMSLAQMAGTGFVLFGVFLVTRR